MEKQLKCRTIQVALFKAIDVDFHKERITEEMSRVCKECGKQCQK